MNLDEYRQLKAQEGNEAKPSSLESYLQEQTNPVTPDVPTTPSEPPEQLETVEDSQKEQEVVPTQTTPLEVDLNGTKISIDELKRGYVPADKYVQRESEIKLKEQEIERHINAMQNPNQQMNPYQMHMMKMQDELADLKLQQEITQMERKYEDFDTREILQLAERTGIVNLEQVYFLNKGMKPVQVTNEPIDVEKVKSELRAELLAELKHEEASTKTLIGTPAMGTIPETPETQLSPNQLRVAKNFGMTPSEYLKWSNKK